MYVCECIRVCLCMGVWGPTSDNYRETARGFVQLYFGHSVQHNRDGQLGHSAGAQKACIHAWPLEVHTCRDTDTNIHQMQTRIHRYDLNIYIVCGYFSMWGIHPTHTQTETCPAAFFCVHIHSDINTHETGDTGDSINQKKHTCTHTHTSKDPQTQPLLVLSAV